MAEHILSGRSVLVTGATGFFGRAFVKTALLAGVKRICIYSRGEAAQATMRADLHKQEGRDPDYCRWFIGDVRDRSRLRRAMEGIELVVHAAALKRVEVGEYNPTEMIQTNINGAQNVIESAIDAGVFRVVALSSDKACEPLNAYGATKLVAEKQFAAAKYLAGEYGPEFAVVRYGNVSGSTGSVIEAWRRAQAAGANIIVTDANATRFWMHVDEAVELVIYALTSQSGGLIVPNLSAYRLGDLLEAMALPGNPLFAYTGLRPGEKMHESLIGVHEAHEFVRVGSYWVRKPSVELHRLTHALTSDLADRMNVEQLREELKTVKT